MSGKLIVCDESHQRRHGVCSVGAIVVEIDRIPEVEARWLQARAEAGIGERRVIHYSMSWPDRERQRPQLIEVVGTLPIRAVIALLEDSRSPQTMANKEMRRDSFIQRRAFEYILQRLAGRLYTRAGEPALVTFHRRSDIKEFEEVYDDAYRNGWTFPPRDAALEPRRIGSLREGSFSATLTTAAKGPLVEIADLVVSSITRWADGRAAAHRGKQVSELRELDVDARSLIDLFPVGVPDDPPRRRGYSIVTHSERRVSKEVLRDHVDRWASDLQSDLMLQTQVAAVLADDIPF